MGARSSRPNEDELRLLELMRVVVEMRGLVNYAHNELDAALLAVQQQTASLEVPVAFWLWGCVTETETMVSLAIAGAAVAEAAAVAA